MHIDLHFTMFRIILFWLLFVTGCVECTVWTDPPHGNILFEPGKPFRVSCMGDNNSSFWWWRATLSQFHDQAIYYPFTYHYEDDNFEATDKWLLVKNPQPDFEGRLCCKGLIQEPPSTPATNYREHGNFVLRLEPRIKEFDVDPGAFIGQRLELNCSVVNTKAPVNITWLRADTLESAERDVIYELSDKDAPTKIKLDNSYELKHDVYVKSVDSHTKTLCIDQVQVEHRMYYVCVVDNGFGERKQRGIFIRPKDRLVAVWPLLGIIGLLLMLFAIIHVYETGRARDEINDLKRQQHIQSMRQARSDSLCKAYEKVPLADG